jgi:hypothetical protein
MQRRNFLSLLILGCAGLLSLVQQAFGQRGGGRGGGRGGSGGNRSSRSRSGSSRSNKSKKSSPQKSKKGSSGGRSSSGRRTSKRRSGRSSRHGSYNRRRRSSRSRRHRRGRWRHHRCWHHRRWYRGLWIGLVFITVALFATIAASSTAYTYGNVSYYHYNPWYRKVLHDGEEGYALSGAPVGHRSDSLPDDAEKVDVDGKTYFYADWSFWQKTSDGGYVVVDAPIGAEVSTIPEEAAKNTEGDVVLYQFDQLFLTEDKNSSGKKIYRVEPQPAEEEINSIPKGSPSFEADGETYHYVDYNFYVAYDENGQRGYVVGDPEIGAQVNKLPDGVTEVEEGGQKYFQFDSVFFEEVETEEGDVFFEVVGTPGEEDVELEN